MLFQGFHETDLYVSNYSSVDVLVIGAGPTGLGAAKRLKQIVRLVTPIARSTTL